MKGNQVLHDIFQRQAGKVLIIDPRISREITYGQLYDDSLKLASVMREMGLGKGDYVAFSMDNCWELAALYLGCMHLGARILPLNPLLHPSEFTAILTAIEVSEIFVSTQVRHQVGHALDQIEGLHVHCFRPEHEPERQDRLNLCSFDFSSSLATVEKAPFSLTDHNENDVFLTIFSSGTTGRPKGISHHYQDLLGNGLQFGREMGLGPNSRFFNVLPMTYLGGFYNLFLIPVLAEGSLVIDNLFGMSTLYGFWETTAEHGINTLWFNSTMISMLLSISWEAEEIDFLPDQISCALCGMAPLPPDMKTRFEKTFGFPLYENYGLSETTFITTQHPGRPRDTGSQGTALEGVEVQIVDKEMNLLPPGTIGQIKVKTKYLMAGYERCSEADLATILDDDSFLTGDLGMLDQDGELTITGRLKDIIIRGGINISPKAIEDRVYSLKEVEEAAVIGLPHPVHGEEVALAVKLRPGLDNTLSVDDLKAFCDKNIANYQRPKFIFIIDEMPRGITGKIQKNVLAKLIGEKTSPLGM